MRTPSVNLRRVLAAVAVAVAAVPVVAWSYQAVTRPPGTDDGARVYCLAAERRADLVDAASALGLASASPTDGQLRWHDRQGGPDQWRQDRPADFDRACLALISAAGRAGGGGGGPSPWATLTPSLVLAAASAALAAWFSHRLATVGVRRAEADTLRAAARQYRLAVEPLLRHVEEALPGLLPNPEEIRRGRQELASRLRAVADARRSWGLPRRLATALDERPDGPLYDAPRGSAGADLRSTWVQHRRTELNRLEAEVGQVAQAVESPGVLPGRTPAGLR
ncbi:hypothetical protein ABT336_19565 [Micromonospora sp. NPDC000207]|uniref:hypothetical protein n=1 Tax=Micromonospora sp. NPDC000207 TaxID=3154246 RepID=UPI0033312756